MNFIAIDVETANANMASICQIGLVAYSDGLPVDEWVTYIDPEDYFDGINVSIHGIDELTVKGSPNFLETFEKLISYLQGNIVVCHTHFDRVAVHQACQRNSLEIPQINWLDSARVARRTWPECSSKGYGLYDVCKLLNYTFKHHDALEDAKATAHILCAAVEKSGFDLDAWQKRVKRPIGISASNSSTAIKREGDPEGELFGEVLVFTGSLEIPRREAADLAASIGCNVASGVTKKTTLLVVGDQDVTKLSGHGKSSKYRKAEELILKGANIRILRESDFKELVSVSHEAV